MSRSQSTPAQPKPRFSFGTTTNPSGPKKVDMLLIKMIKIHLKKESEPMNKAMIKMMNEEDQEDDNDNDGTSRCQRTGKEK